MIILNNDWKILSVFKNYGVGNVVFYNNVDDKMEVGFYEDYF